MNLLAHLSSLKWSAWVLLWLVLAVPLVSRGVMTPLVVLGIGGGVFLVNLSAFLWSSSFFRTRPGLLVFHLALAAFLLLAGVGRLTWMEGHVEMTTGEWFSGLLLNSTRGLLHDGGIEGLRFVNDGFTIDYGPGLRRGPTRNRVRWQEERGQVVQGVIGDDLPLVLRHYRIYTTANKGFAPIFRWHPEKGDSLRTALHLPSYPLFADQSNTWTLPDGGPTLAATLNLEEPVIDETKAGRFRLPERYSLKLAANGGEPVVLRPGGVLPVAGGRLVFEGLTSWMGYRIHYDRTRSWLLAAVLMGVGGLAWHFRVRFALHRWESPKVR
ncbi:MAG: hypothetical protein HQM00_05365 [Magnetococcales bacterium]|nr:hypothetical protein [Magnetococcales bacterium]